MNNPGFASNTLLTCSKHVYPVIDNSASLSLLISQVSKFEAQYSLSYFNTRSQSPPLRLNGYNGPFPF
jgi:hypothetical protein